MTTNPSPIARHIASLAVAARFGGGSPLDGVRFNLLGGSPAPEALPTEGLAAAAAEVLARDDAARVTLNYSDVLGNAALRQWIADREGVDARRVVITNGALHGISLLSRVLLDPGDTVVVEDPTFIVALLAWQLEDARIERLPVSANGFDIQRLKDALQKGLRPKLVYVIADFQNPTGTVLENDGRAALVDLAENYGFTVLWDNPYRDSRFAGETRADVRTDSDRVVKVNTFSKSVGPGLRLGWLVLPEWLVDPIVNVRRRTDQQPPTFSQAVVASLVTTPGAFDGLLDRTRILHRERAQALTGSLSRHAGGALRFAEPEGGFFLWTTLADADIDPDALQGAARESGLIYVAGERFSSPGSEKHARALRLGFTNSTPEQLANAGEVLGQALETARRPVARRA